MPKVIFIQHDGAEQAVDAVAGTSIMQTALDNLVPGIGGDCGGCATCATCQGYIAPDFIEKLAPMSADEKMMLEGASNVRENSRLTCQILMSEDLDGIVVRLPESQL